jgi:hypothetical protein
MDGAAFFAWAFSCCQPSPRLRFITWDDPRQLVSPGEPDRTNDLVALLRDDDKPQRPVRMVVEVEDEPEKGALYRMGQYEILLARQVNPDCDPTGPAVGSLLINLTGQQRVRYLEWQWAEGIFGMRLAPFIVDVAKQDGPLTLGKIEKKEVGLPILPLLAAMRHGGTRKFIERWKQAVAMEEDESRRPEYREAALVFAELTRNQVKWLRATEGWLMRKSEYITSWEKVGEERGILQRSREWLVTRLQQLEDPVPEAIRLAIEGTNDAQTLDRWFKAALACNTIAEFRKAMKRTP